jgi:HK97 family phage major capsid protein
MKLSPGAQITNALLEHPERRRFSLSLERKAGPILVYPSTAETVPAVAPGPTIPYRLRSLIAPGTTVGSGILYARETSFTSSPIVPTAAGGLKPAADLTYDIQLQPVVTVPAYLKMPAQYWEDFSMFQSWIDARMMYGLAEAEEKQLLNGNGVAPNLQGFMLVAIAVTSVAGSGGVALLDNVAAGIGALYTRGYIATGIVLNPGDWGAALQIKSTGGGYLIGAPGLITNPLSLWGIPVVLSKAMASGNYLVGQFDPYSQIFDRDDAALEVADQNEDDFVRNLVTVRAEERLASAIYQPAAFAKGTFTMP